MNRQTKQWLNDVPWPSDTRRPRLWPLIVIYYVGSLAILAVAVHIPAQWSGYLVAVSIAWSLGMLWPLYRLTKRQVVWDRANNGKGYDYSRWG